MPDRRTVGRLALLTLALLSGGAASDWPGDDAPGRSTFTPHGAYGDYLNGRYAASRTDMETAADSFLAAMEKDPNNPEVEQQAFLASVMTGRPEARRLARSQQGNPAAQLVLADQDARAGRWDQAEARYAALPRSDINQVLKPMLVAWAQHGAGRTDVALLTLQPMIESGRFRGIYALHAALIADQGNRPADAASLYQVARQDYGELNLRLGTILASWQARQGQVAAAQEMIDLTVVDSPDLGIARTALQAGAATPIVAVPTDGIAEVYMAMAASLRQQDSTDFALLLLRLALDMRPDLTAARLLIADIQDAAKHPRVALGILEKVPQTDPLIAVVRLRQASLTAAAGQGDEARGLLEALARDYPDRPEPLAQMADLLRRKERFVEAVAAYDRAIERVPRPTAMQWPLFYQRGVAQDRAGQWDKAEADLSRALLLSPDQPYVMNYLGYGLTERGRDLSRARQLLDRAALLRPNDGAIVDSLGWIQLMQGDTANAIRNLERAVELQSEDATINGHLGDALFAAGRAREAEFQWRRALNLKPEPDEAARLEAKLRALPDATPATAAETQGSPPDEPQRPSTQ